MARLLLATLLLSAGAAHAVAFQTGLNGTWWNPAQDGQGFVIHVIPEANQVFVAWFTYESDGGQQMWITGSGTLDAMPASLQLLRPAGGALNQTAPAPQMTAWGTATLSFDSCTQGTFSYSGEVSGTIQIERLTPVVSCDEGAGP